jgi:hypothetical protein
MILCHHQSYARRLLPGDGECHKVSVQRLWNVWLSGRGLGPLRHPAQAIYHLALGFRQETSDELALPGGRWSDLNVGAKFPVAWLAIAALMLAVAMSVTAIPAVYAYDSDVRSDWRRLQRDRAALRDERRELGAAERWENWALRHGRFWPTWRAERLERHEAADGRALQAKVNRDRADLRNDIREW